MQALLLVFAIGVLNLCLGYAVAVRLGYGPPTLRDAWLILSELSLDLNALRGRDRSESASLSPLDAIPGLELDSIADPDPAPDALEAWRPPEAHEAVGADRSDDSITAPPSAASDSTPPTTANLESEPAPIGAPGGASGSATSEAND